MMGSMDMRTLGYFTVTRENLNRIMKDHCKFLTEDETYEYFGLLNKYHKNIINYAQDQVRKIQNLQDNTKLVDRRNSPVLTPEDEKDTNIIPDKDKDPYPWLAPEDPRRNMTDKEILEKFVDLSDSDLTKKEKEQLYKVLLKYKAAVSLRDEIGLCPNMEVELELTDTSPFFIRPFPIKESEKEVVDKDMRKGCLLGILKKGISSYNSPIMLIPRKLTGIPRIVTDFRHLNSRLVTLQPSIPLVRDTIQILGASGCEVLSLAAYHTLRLSKKSQKYCGIMPYYGSDSYLYQRLGMGLSVSPAIWQNFIQKVLQEIPNYRKNHLAIMDDCLVHSKKKDHMSHLINLFKALIRNGLKISPKKCKLSNAYHTLRLSKKSQKYCGIMPYYGSDSYLYQRLGMGLSVSPAIWQNFIQKVLQEIPNYRKNHLAIMDDCLVHSKKKDHMSHLINLFKALIRNGLKISPKKCKLSKTKLVYSMPSQSGARNQESPFSFNLTVQIGNFYY